MRNLVRGSLVLVAFAVLLAIPRPAAAQYYYAPRPVYGPPLYAPQLKIDRPGVYIGAAAVGAIILNQANTDSSASDFITHGGGGQIWLGVKVHPMFALEFGYAQTAHNTYTDYWGNVVDYLALHALTADAKLIFPNRYNVRPYVQAGIGYYALTQGYNDATSGGGFQLGGGLDIYLNPWWSLGGRVLYHGVKFTDIQGNALYNDNKPFLSYMSIELNVQVHF
jgi:hypothetical protein